MKQIIKVFLAAILKDIGVPDAGIAVEVSENPVHGDYTTNVAMLLAGRLKAPPIEIAQQIVDAITKYQKESGGNNPKWLTQAEAAPPGFVNLWLSEAYFGSQIAEVLEKKEAYGNARNMGDRDEKQEKKGGTGSGAKTNLPQSPILPVSPLSSSLFAGKPAKKGGVASFGKTIMVEFAHPNTHKAFHIGHLRNITTGESIVRLLESQGNAVIRANYQGDVGMHIAKALYALLELAPYKNELSALHPRGGVAPAAYPGSVGRQADGSDLMHQRVAFLGRAYAAGSKAFEEDKKAQETIIDLNALIYASAQRYAKEVGRNPGTTEYLLLVKHHVHPIERVYELWKETRQWSLDYFETIYERVDSHYDRLYFESECLAGVDRAKDAVKRGILKQSDGAIIFDGKPYGIDTRVFVNSLGLPTYEGKELALSSMETTEFGQLNRIIHVVGPEQASFFSVTFKAEELLGIVKPGVQHHLIYGWVKLKKGKMSSRLGNVILGEWLLDEAKKSIYKILDKSASPQPVGGQALKVTPVKGGEKDDVAEKAAIAAVKYAFLRVGTRQEIAFDLAESVSFDGDSGPYLLYSYARGKSVLRKSLPLDPLGPLGPLNPEERAIARRIAQFPDVVADSAKNFTPNTLCTYLFHLAQEFNLFYAKHAILGEPQRLALTAAAAQVLKNGLYFLGIQTVERM